MFQSVIPERVFKKPLFLKCFRLSYSWENIYVPSFLKGYVNDYIIWKNCFSSLFLKTHLFLKRGYFGCTYYYELRRKYQRIFVSDYERVFWVSHSGKCLLFQKRISVLSLLKHSVWVLSFFKEWFGCPYSSRHVSGTLIWNKRSQ